MTEQKPETKPVNPDDAIFLAGKAIGDFIGFLGKGHEDIEAARKKAERVQYLLVAIDNEELKQKFPLDSERQKKLFDKIFAWKSDKALLEAEEEIKAQAKAKLEAKRKTTTKKAENQPEELDEYEAAKALVDARKGLGPEHKAVPPFGQIMGKYIDGDLMNNCVGLQLGARILTYLNEPLLEKLEANQKFKTDGGYPAKVFDRDAPAVKDATQAIIDLNKLFLEGNMPKTLEEQKPYLEAALIAIDTAKEKIPAKYASLVDKFDAVMGPYYENAKASVRNNASPERPKQQYNPK